MPPSSVAMMFVSALAVSVTGAVGASPMRSSATLLVVGE
jgi:hypothetical protein